ncbi:DUF6049 family protein [Nonomuraea sp. NEAU-A123]|uniref:DUF6049 family protein n=1 Tax=Nonomuraea sp. NEAU-A123 TaxID=2839649 RepID=UPI001BE4B3A3|nr:DUF6049 family protein [Nonomuraea sp. NEAU-A123]MBT2226360.1 hypothetical protein [Nonomuraea sp. NEAU-A123]
MIRKATLLAVLSAALLAPTVATTPSTAAVKTPGTTAAKAIRQSMAISITSITPDVPTSQTTQIKITGTVRNDMGEAMTNLRVQLRYSAQKFPDRATMSAYQSDPNTATLPPIVSQRVSFMDIPALDAGASKAFEILATPVQLGLTSFGVYPVAVDVARFNVPLTSLRTYLTYAPPTPQKLPHNRLAIALPIIDQAHRAEDDNFVDDKLGALLTGKGRLAQLAGIASTAPKSVTWFLEPALLDDVQALSKPHRLKGKNQAADPNATKWLDSLRTALADSPVVATPYADPDVAALAHQGLDGQTRTAIEMGRQVATELLKRDVPLTTNWPAGGVLDPDALDLLSVAKVDRVLLNSTNLPPQPPVTFTPDAAGTLDSVQGPVTALVADPELTRTFEPDSTAPSSVLLNKQHFIAETAMIAAEPGQTKPRSLVIAPSRRWDPNPTLVNTLLKTANRLPWLTLTPLSSIKPSKTPTPRAALTYTDQDRKEELSAKYLGPIKDVAAKAQLTSLIAEVPKPHSDFDAAVLRLASASWRNNTRAGRAATKLVNEAVQTEMNKISITGADPDQLRQLAGSNGQVPISVKNTSGETIALYIDVKSNNPALLQIDSTPWKKLLTIPNDNNGGVQVPMSATTSGDATVSVQLMTRNGLKYGKPVKLTIRTTGYTGIALVIVGAALAVMLAAVVTRLLRRRSQRRLARAAKSRESETV